MIDRRAMLEVIGWKLCCWEPHPGNTANYWALSEHDKRKRYYVCPVYPPNGSKATLRDSEEEALRDLPVRLVDSV